MTQIIWNRIFKTHTWLNKVLDQGHRPFLLGSDLFKLQNHDAEPWNYDIALLFEPKLKNMDESDWNTLLETMQPHHVYTSWVNISVEGGYRIRVHLPEFPDYKEEWYPSKTIVYPRTLLTARWNMMAVASAHTYWDGDITKTQKVLRPIARDDVKKITENDLGTVCEVYLQDPKSQLNKPGFEIVRGEKWSLEMTFANVEVLLEFDR
jgi:hypothetical protein